MQLTNKHILFIAPRFYNYHIEIKAALEKKGASVFFFEERFYGLFHLLFSFLGNRTYLFFSKIRYRKLLDNLHRYDYLFVIKGDSMPEAFMQTFKEKNPTCKCIMYQWDSIKSNDFLYLTKYFDRVFSFDLKDCEENANLIYQPLFYFDEIKKIRDTTVQQDIDVLILGTYLPERFSAIKKIQDYCLKEGIQLHYFLYTPKMRFLYVKYFQRIRIKKGDISFKPLKKEDVLLLYQRSKAIVDISNVKQTGLSMRVIECLAAHRKLITTNANIKAHSFFNEQQIQIFDINQIIITKKFLNNGSGKVDEGIEKLHISPWLNNLFEDKQKSL